MFREEFCFRSFIQVLPVDGELILGDYVSLATAAAAATSPSEDANCPGTGRPRSEGLSLSLFVAVLKPCVTRRPPTC